MDSGGQTYAGSYAQDLPFNAAGAPGESAETAIAIGDGGYENQTIVRFPQQQQRGYCPFPS